MMVYVENPKEYTKETPRIQVNSARIEDVGYKNQPTSHLSFYILAINIWKLKFKMQYY